MTKSIILNDINYQNYYETYRTEQKSIQNNKYVRSLGQ